MLFSPQGKQEGIESAMMMSKEEEVAPTTAHFFLFSFSSRPPLFVLTCVFLPAHKRAQPIHAQPSSGKKGGKGGSGVIVPGDAAAVDAVACGGKGEDGGAAKPPDEAERVGFLCGLGILDSPADPRFDDITKLVGIERKRGRD